MTVYWEDIKIQLFTSFFMHIKLLACFFVQYSVVKEKIKEFQLTSINCSDGVIKYMFLYI